MIDISQDFKDQRHGQLIYEFRISEDGGTTWQEIPAEAYPILPLGSLQQRTEDPEPFSFVGPDMELTCRNTSGYWTNAGKTGKVDGAGLVIFRVRSSILGQTEWIKHIQGPVDLTTIRTEAGSLVSFTVRGLLNMLDCYQANVQNATKLISYRTATDVVPGCPSRFVNWLSIEEVDQAHPVGLYELKWNAQEKTAAWAGGEWVEVLQSRTELVGRNGERIWVRSCIGSATAYMGESGEDISQWIAIKEGYPDNTYLKAACEPPITANLGTLKQNLAELVDLDVDQLEVRALDIQGKDAAVTSLQASAWGWNDYRKLTPQVLINLGANRWLISCMDGRLAGTHVITAGYAGVGGSYCYQITNIQQLSSTTYCGAIRAGDYVYMVEDTGGVSDFKRLLTNWKIARLSIYNLGLSTVDGLVGQKIFWKSLAYSADGDKLYMILDVSSTTARPYSLDFAAGTYTALGAAVNIDGPSMIPGVVPEGLNGVYNLYVWATARIVNNINATYLHVYDIDAATQTSYTLGYELDSYYDGISDLADITPISQSGQSVSIFDFVFLLRTGRMMWVSSEAFFAPQAGNDKLHKITIGSSQGLYITGTTKNYTTYSGWPPIPTFYRNTGLTYLYCPAIFREGLVGAELYITSGDNNGLNQTISAVNYYGGFMKITVDAPFTYPILENVSFKIQLAFVLETSSHIEQTSDYGDGKFLQNGLSSDGRGLMDIDNKKIIYEAAENGDSLIRGASLYSEKLCYCTPNNLYVADLAASTATTGGNQYPEVNVNDYENKSVREMLEDLAVSIYGRLIPSEHSGKLKLWSRGGTPMAVYTIARNQYRYAGQWEPYFNYDRVKVDDIEYGPVAVLNQNRELALTSPQICPFNKRSLAKAVYDNIGVGDRRHIIDTDWLIWLEPGDRVYLTLDDDTTKECDIIGTETDFGNKTHRLYLQEA